MGLRSSQALPVERRFARRGTGGIGRGARHGGTVTRIRQPYDGDIPWSGRGGGGPPARAGRPGFDDGRRRTSAPAGEEMPGPMERVGGRARGGTVQHGGLPACVSSGAGVQGPHPPVRPSDTVELSPDRPVRPGETVRADEPAPRGWTPPPPGGGLPSGRSTLPGCLGDEERVVDVDGVRTGALKGRNGI